MSALTRQIREAVAARLAAVNGAGGYTYDLSATGRIVHASGEIETERIPGAAVWTTGFTRTPGLQMGYYTQTTRIGVAGFVPAASDDPGAGAAAAEDLADDLLTAIEGNRTLGLESSGVLDLVIESAQLFGSSPTDGREFGAVYLEVVVTAEVRTGA